jgi:hypothetical protein
VNLMAICYTALKHTSISETRLLGTVLCCTDHAPVLMKLTVQHDSGSDSLKQSC